MNCRTKNGLTFSEWAEKHKEKPYVKSMIEYYKKLPSSSLGLYKAFQLYSGSGAIVGFKPLVARWICLNYKPTTILDFCAGWGGRLLGALSTNTNYIGYDTNTDLIEPYTKLLEECDSSGTAQIYFEDSSKADFSAHTYDMILTSPPYFLSGSSTQERYPHMPSYTSKEQFNKEFFLPVLRKAWAGLSEEGWCILNLPKSMALTAKQILGQWDEMIPLGLKSRSKPDATTSYDEGLYVWKKRRTLPPATFVNDWVDVRKSTLPGTDMWGLFAKQEIPQGCKIALYQGVEMSLQEFRQTYGQDLRFVRSLRQINKYLVGKEYPYLTENPSHYANESGISRINIGFKRRYLIALRPIQKDEELFLQYMKDYPRDYYLEDDLTSEFYDLWDSTDVLVVKKAFEIRDSPSLTVDEKRQKLQALLDSGSKTFSSSK